jgi:hypothetical protein
VDVISTSAVAIFHRHVVAARSLRRELTEPVPCSHAAVRDNVAAGDEATIGAHEERANGCDLVRRPCAPSRTDLDHAPVACATRPVSSSLASGVMMISGLIVFDPRTALAQRHIRNELPRFASWYA